MTKIPMIVTKLVYHFFYFEHLSIVMWNLFEMWFLDPVISFISVQAILSEYIHVCETREYNHQSRIPLSRTLDTLQKKVYIFI